MTDKLPPTFRGTNVPIIGQSQARRDRFDQEYGEVFDRDGLVRGDVQDSEILQIETVLNALTLRVGQHRDYDSFQREIKDRFFKIGFAVDVAWYEFAIDGVKQEGALLPYISVVGRVDKTPFDHDQKVHEITNDLLELPGQEKGKILRADKEQFEGRSKGHQH